MEPDYSRKETPKILIVDDIGVNVTILDNILTHEGYETLCALSVQEAIEIMKQAKPSLILSDLSMPEIDGLEFCRMLKSDPKTRDIPFIFITVLNTSNEKEKAFSTGAVDFIPKPFDEVEVIMRVSNHLKSYQLQQEMADYNRKMHTVVDAQKKQIAEEQENVLSALVKLMKKHSPDMGEHQENVGYNCGLLAQGLQFLPYYENLITDEFVETIGTAAKLHDIGSFVMQNKKAFGEKKSRKQNPEYVRACSDEGAEILEDIGGGQDEGAPLSMAVNIARYHHANWDGTGYPAVSGKSIPLEARIVALANDFDDLITSRNGHKACPVEESIRIINGKSGSCYDPDVVKVFNKIWRQMR